MRVQLMYFAGLRDLVQLSAEDYELPSDVRSVASLLSHLPQHHPALTGRLDSVRVAVNESFVPTDTALSANDVIALIPPVAGG